MCSSYGRRLHPCDDDISCVRKGFQCTQETRCMDESVFDLWSSDQFCCRARRHHRGFCLFKKALVQIAATDGR